MLPKKAKDFKIKQADNLDTKKVNNAVGGYGYELKQFGEATEKEMQAWADAKMAKSRMAMVKGYIKTGGDSAYKVGDIIRIARVSDMFNEKTMISGIKHSLTIKTGWQTQVLFGLSSEWFSENDDITEACPLIFLPMTHSAGEKCEMWLFGET